MVGACGIMPAVPALRAAGESAGSLNDSFSYDIANSQTLSYLHGNTVPHSEEDLTLWGINFGMFDQTQRSSAVTACEKTEWFADTSLSVRFEDKKSLNGCRLSNDRTKLAGLQAQESTAPANKSSLLVIQSRYELFDSDHSFKEC
eukprot:768667-Hanusia_phi.AAC.4